MSVEIIQGDCREVLPKLPARSVNMCVTSPPYFGLRNYGMEKQLGRERTPEEYVKNLVEVFRHVHRVLMDNATLFLNVGDTYADESDANALAKAPRSSNQDGGSIAPTFVKPKDLFGIPWRVAFALQADGWHLRSDIIWHKPNPKPDGIDDRPTKAHEYVFLLTKRERYHYDADAIREPITSTGGACFGKQLHDSTGTGAQSRRLKSAAQRNNPKGKNKRSVWTIPVASFHGAHFAVFPPDLVRPCILAGCPEHGTVLDPFSGSGTVGVVAAELHRNAILIELNPVYVEMQKKRLAVHGVFGSHITEAVMRPNEAPSSEAKPRSKNPGFLWDEL
jgi:site-specific DNA-methyltransferase (adenine-specific)